MNKPSSSDTLKLPESWQQHFLLFTIGLVSICGSFFVFWASSKIGNNGLEGKSGSVFFRSYLTNFTFIFSFSLGSLFFVLIQFLCRAGWSASIRRLAELTASLIPFLAVLFIPIIVLLYFNSTSLYEWNSQELTGLIAKKTGYLEKNFFTVRTLICFVVLGGMAAWIYRTSRKQDDSGDVQLTLKIQKWSGPMVMAFALITSTAAFDWIMSLDADWYSTIFGVYWFAGSMMSMFAFLILSFSALQKYGKVQDKVNVEHYHDMGKFLFGFVMFWAYIAFSQLLLYWYGNIPEETAWYKIRYKNGWEVVSYVLIVMHFAIPFLALLSRHVRRHKVGLTFFAGWAIVVHWIDMTYLVMPAEHLPGVLGWLPMIGHLLCGIGMSSIFLGLLVLRAADVPLVALRDPRLDEAMSYTNPLF